jgi:NAD-dependent deacetylase
MKNVVFFTGSGISKESGIQTFRDAGEGLWENFSIEEVCTHEAILYNRNHVIDFYNMMRGQLLTKKPNAAHLAITELQKNPDFHVEIVTQNVDDLHERAGSTNVIHLHGELMKVTSSRNPNDPRCIRTLDKDHLVVKMGDCAGDGSQLRPFIVWFGEAVPEIERAAMECMKADVFIIIGTSLNVYPAAGLTQYVPATSPIYLIDPKPVQWNADRPFRHIMKGASLGMQELMEEMEKPTDNK